MGTVLDRTALVAQIDQPDRLAELKVRATERFAKKMASLQPDEIKKGLGDGTESGILKDLNAIDCESQLDFAIMNLFLYSTFQDAQA